MQKCFVRLLFLIILLEAAEMVQYNRLWRKKKKTSLQYYNAMWDAEMFKFSGYLESIGQSHL